MQYAKLGKTNVKVSRICLGTNNFGSQLSENQAAKVIKKAVEVGINFIDTANVYVNGRSEEIIGRSARGDRNRLVIATKVGYSMTGDPEGIDLSRENVFAKAEDSLRRLQTDHIDLYYLHGFDPKVPLEETLRAMDQLVRDGRVGHVGVSNFSAEQLRAALHICEENDFATPAALQPRYNLMVRDPEEDLFPFCVQEGLGVVTYSPLAGGFLTGKYSKGMRPPAGTRAAFNEKYWNRYNNDDSFAKLDRLSMVAREAKIPISTLALCWILSKPSVTSPIVGASLPEQVEENSRALEKRVPRETLAQLESVV